MFFCLNKLLLCLLRGRNKIACPTSRLRFFLGQKLVCLYNNTCTVIHSYNHNTGCADCPTQPALSVQ